MNPPSRRRWTVRRPAPSATPSTSRRFRTTSGRRTAATCGRTGRPSCHALDELGLAELTRRWDEAQQLIRENGVTYNVYGDPRGMDRPWQLDPIPLLIVARRTRTPRSGPDPARPAARSDPRRPLRPAAAAAAAGLLPPELVFGHPGFLRPCHGVRLPGEPLSPPVRRRPRPLGGRHVLGPRRPHAGAVRRRLRPGEPASSCRACCPRSSAIARCSGWPCSSAPSATRCRPIAPHNRDNPRIVLLTPGPYNETYFEHAYLARYLGYTLVEGGDLTVRDNRVYLKLLGGLQPVDVILRRLDDDFCDPLELRGDSFLGVPGPGAGGAGGQRRGRQRRSAAAWSRRRRCCRSCPACAGTCWARTCRCPRCRPGGAATRRPATTCWPTWASW